MVHNILFLHICICTVIYFKISISEHSQISLGSSDVTGENTYICIYIMLEVLCNYDM